MRLAMVKFKIKFVEIWLNFKESQDVSYMLMSNESSLVYLLCSISILLLFYDLQLSVLDSFYSCHLNILDLTSRYGRGRTGIEQKV